MFFPKEYAILVSGSLSLFNGISSLLNSDDLKRMSVDNVECGFKRASASS